MTSSQDGVKGGMVHCPKGFISRRHGGLAPGSQRDLERASVKQVSHADW